MANDRQSTRLLYQTLDYLIANGPGRSAIELSKAIYGDGEKGTQQRVNPACNALITFGRVERRGGGVPNDPFRYYPLDGGNPIP